MYFLNIVSKLNKLRQLLKGKKTIEKETLIMNSLMNQEINILLLNQVYTGTKTILDMK